MALFEASQVKKKLRQRPPRSPETKTGSQVRASVRCCIAIFSFYAARIFILKNLLNSRTAVSKWMWNCILESVVDNGPLYLTWPAAASMWPMTERLKIFSTKSELGR